MKNKKSFIMYTDYQKHINRLSDEEAGRLIKAVLEYTNTSIEPELSPAADMAFSFIKEQIDRDLEKWEETCQKRSEAGKLGGRPRTRKDPDLAPESNTEPKQSKAKKAIAAFKIREGVNIGCKVTLRSGKMYDFAYKLFNVALPRVRDFRGVSKDSFDGRGNYSMGIKEQLIFPEIEYDKVDKIRGMDIIFVTTAKTDEEAKELLSLMGMPFKA